MCNKRNPSHWSCFVLYYFFVCAFFFAIIKCHWHISPIFTRTYFAPFKISISQPHHFPHIFMTVIFQRIGNITQSEEECGKTTTKNYQIEKFSIVLCGPVLLMRTKFIYNVNFFLLFCRYIVKMECKPLYFIIE